MKRLINVFGTRSQLEPANRRPVVSWPRPAKISMDPYAAMSFVQKIASLAAEMGWRNTAWYLFKRVVEAFPGNVRLIRYVLVAQPVRDQALIPPRWGRSISINQIAPDDHFLVDLPVTEEVLRYRFAQDALCFGAFRDGQIVGSLWLSFDFYDEDEVRCQFIPWPTDTAVWDFDVYIDPAQRGGIVFGRLWDAANEYLREREISWSLSRISAFNPASIAAHKRLGAVPRGWLTALRAGRWQMAICSVAPRIHLSCGSGSIPHYRVPAAPPKGYRDGQISSDEELRARNPAQP